MKVFFVGMHNKSGMMPLDSRTMTGKVIDKIIAGLGCECVKTNLCDIDYFPKDKKVIWAENLLWSQKYEPTDKSIICLLGRWVQTEFLLTNAKIVKLTHPAGVFGPKNKEEYIAKSIQKILSA